jgi:excinuclease ABC subunit C
VKGLFSRLAFTGFGPTALAPAPGVPRLFAIESRRPSRLRDKVRRECPACPGVYGMVDLAGELVYVGKAKCLRARLLSYFRRNSRDPKAGRILENTRVVAWEHAPSEFAALLRELELIRRWEPRFNVHGQPRRRRRAYVCLGRRPAPYAFLAPRPPASAVATFGPVPAGDQAAEAVRRVNDLFGLRDCPRSQTMIFAEQRELFPVVRAAGCIRYEIGTCLGPCAAAVTRAAYGAGVRAARVFLEGLDPKLLETLEGQMAAASEALAFERAAALRDKLDALQWLHRHLERLRQAAERSLVYPVAGEEGDATWYLIRRGRVQAAVAAPADGAGRRAAAAALDAVYGAAPPVPGPLSLDEIDGVLLVAGWFRRHAAERDRALDPEAARALCRA